LSEEAIFSFHSFDEKPADVIYFNTKEKSWKAAVTAYLQIRKIFPFPLAFALVKCYHKYDNMIISDLRVGKCPLSILCTRAPTEICQQADGYPACE
jgi:hypothetical protein